MLNRRFFLKSLGWSGAALTTAPAALAQADKPAQTPARISGRVTGNGKGLANVSVTDGFTITQTDRNGQYSLPADGHAEFIYISIPAGYAFPHDQGITRFYKPLAAVKDTFTADFALDKLPVDDTNHQFVVWADTQMISKADAEQLKAGAAPDLRDLVASYPKGALFHGIGCGDLVWDHFELYDDYKQAVTITGVPFFNVIGNHDLDLEARSDEASANTFRKQFGPTYYSFNRGRIHYVVLDDVFSIGATKKYIGYLPEAQLHWLEQDLATVKPGTTVVVSLHIPTQTGHARRNKLKEEEISGTVANRKHLYELLKPFKVHIMSGHTHVNEKWEADNIVEHVHGTVCGAWWTGPICSDGSPAGYGVYEVKGNDISWYYKSTGKSREHQLRIYEKGRIKDAPEQMAVNVWNWDPSWKIEWLEDGMVKGKPESRVALDPWATELYAGPDLPKKHKFVDPTPTDHLFFFTPSAGVKEITVRATDRFGKVYTETMKMA